MSFISPYARCCFVAASCCVFTLGGCDQASSPNPAAPAAKTAPPQAAATPGAPAAATTTPSLPVPAPTFTPLPASSPPFISLESDTHDFGTFPETVKKTASLKFTNTGGQPLVIHKINTSCGCTTAKMDKMQYAPGESGQITLTLEPTGPGTDNKLVNIFSNSQPPPPDGFSRITLRANIQPFLIISPRMIPDESGKLAVFEFRKEHHFTVTVSCPPDENFTIEKVVATDPNCKAKVMPSAPGAKSKLIDIAVDANAPWGGFFSWLEITGNGKPAPDAPPISHTSKIRVQIKLYGKIQAEPDDTFRFGAKPGEKLQRKIRLHHKDDLPFTLTSATLVSCDIPGTTVESAQISPSEYELTMSMTADQLRPRADGLVVVTTNIPGEEQINIPILGVVRTDPGGVR